jgi:hypothetical protein
VRISNIGLFLLHGRAAFAALVSGCQHISRAGAAYATKGQSGASWRQGQGLASGFAAGFCDQSTRPRLT